ncbi:hypothetical protein ENUP19_0083G0022 [Entamoeba nuttalli]
MKTLYVSDVDVSIDENKLKELFSPYGNVINSTIKKSSKGTNDFYYAFIEYDRPEDAAKALREMDQHELAGKRLNVKFAKPKDGRPYLQKPFYTEFKKRDPPFDSPRDSPRRRSFSRERGRLDDGLYPPSHDLMYDGSPMSGRYLRKDIPQQRVHNEKRQYRDRFESRIERPREKDYYSGDSFYLQDRYARDDYYGRSDRYSLRDSCNDREIDYDRYNSRRIDRMSDRISSERERDHIPVDPLVSDRPLMDRPNSDRDYYPSDRMRDSGPYRRDDIGRDIPYSRDRYDPHY